MVDAVVGVGVAGDADSPVDGPLFSDGAVLGELVPPPVELGTVNAPGASGTSWTAAELRSNGLLMARVPLRITSVICTGSRLTATSLPTCLIATTRPTASRLANIILPGCRSLTPGALPFIVHTRPSDDADLIACGPPPISTTSGW